MAPELQRAENAHQYLLSRSTLLTAVRLAVLAQNHSRADLALGMIIIERHILIIQEREDVIAVLARPLGKPPSIGIFICSFSQLGQPEAKPPVVVPRCSSLLVHQIVKAWQNWQGSRRDFIRYAARTFDLLIAQVVRLLRLLGVIATHAQKAFRHRGSTRKLSPGAMLVTDGKKVAVELTVSKQWTAFNWQRMADQATGCDTAFVLSKKECAAAVGTAYQQSVIFAGGRSPTGLLHDNKPRYEDSRLKDHLQEHGTLMIPPLRRG